MFKLTTTFLLSFVLLQTNAQTLASYREDIDHLYAILKKTPSFKDQVRGSRLTAYNQLYKNLKNDTSFVVTDFDAFTSLAQLFFPFMDNHLGFYQLPKAALTKASLTDSVAINAYKSSALFRQYPTLTISTDSLATLLENKPKDSIEGIYYYDNYLTVGLYRTSIASEYVGVVLASTLPHWEKGQVAIRLYEYQPHCFRAIYGHPLFKSLMLYSNEKFRNQSLINSSFYSSVTESVYKKNPEEPDFVTIKKSEASYSFKTIHPHIQYIRLGSFSSSNSNMAHADVFLNSIKDSLIADHLIVDLRNNTGGGPKVSNKFLKLIRSFSKKGKVYVLINNGTMSQGEIFTLQLKKKSNAKTFGQTTMGTLAYGSNYGKIEKLPSKSAQVYITDMRSKASYRAYETVGVTPDVVLQNDGDWIEKLIKEIERN